MRGSAKSAPPPSAIGFLPGAVVLSVAYLAGLLASAVPGGQWLLLLAGIGAAFSLPQRWRWGPRPALWLAAALVAWLAGWYFTWRTPEPGPTDISRLAPQADVTVQGEVASLPRLTRSGRAQLWLRATRLDPLDGNPKLVSGQLYVTLPLTQATGLHPNQAVEIMGTLYRPDRARNPRGFDFRAYLVRQGAFAGLSGRRVAIKDPEAQLPEPRISDVNPSPLPKPALVWGWWRLPQRIVHAQVLGLGSPDGPLLSSLVLGSRAVDLPYDIRDKFVQAGLAHAFAASGFQVSLLLGLALGLLRGRPPRQRFLVGLAVLVIYPLLTGLSPSILRASLMGLGALVALVRERKVQPLGMLLLAAVTLLLVNPLWIWDLGFQLSFLATLGLLVSVPPITRALDWLPPTLASALAVPLAAYLWTLPLQLYAFGRLTPYSLLTNVLTTPLMSVATIGGMASAVLGIGWAGLGAAVAWCLAPVLQLLVSLVRWSNQLPGSFYNVGAISVIQVVLLYGLMVLVWRLCWWQRHWRFALGLAVLLVAVPSTYAHHTRFQVTLLAAERSPVMVVQDRGQVLLLNSGDETTAALTVLPFLQQQGINRIDWAVATDARSELNGGWEILRQQLSVGQFRDGGFRTAPRTYLDLVSKLRESGTVYRPLIGGEVAQMGRLQVQFLSLVPLVLSLSVDGQPWLLLGNDRPQPGQSETLDSSSTALNSKPLPLSQAQVLWWDGAPLAADLLQAVQPKVAIATAMTLTDETSQSLAQLGARVFWRGRDGALVWTPQQGFQTTLDRVESVEGGTD